MPETEANLPRLDLKRRNEIQLKLAQRLGFEGLDAAKWLSEHGGKISGIIDTPDFIERLQKDEESAFQYLVSLYKPGVEKAA
jgi:hypothetical protein